MFLLPGFGNNHNTYVQFGQFRLNMQSCWCMNLYSTFSTLHTQMHFTRNEWNEACDHNIGSSMPYSFIQIVCAFFDIPLGYVDSEGLWGGVYSWESLSQKSICGCNYKNSTFSSVILRPWVLVQLESNSQLPTRQSNNWVTSALYTPDTVQCNTGYHAN